MTPEGLRRRIMQGRSASLIYENDDRSGVITIWRHEGSVIVTWEEWDIALDRGFYNEHAYTRDERHVFADFDAACGFLRDRGVDLARFEP
jgi:hypothetical protein